MQDGRTALHNAAYRNSTEVPRLLVARCPHVVDCVSNVRLSWWHVLTPAPRSQDGETALDIAREINFVAVVAFLEVRHSNASRCIVTPHHAAAVHGHDS